MRHKLLRLQAMVVIALCVIMGMAFNSCSDDDPKSTKSIEGEWISTNGHIYYQFLSDGTGRYICLADEPGYDPNYPDAAINKPVDPYYFDYTLDGDILTMKEYYGAKENDDYTIYVYDYVVSQDVLQIRLLRSSRDGINWIDYSYPDWSTYKRWSPRK